VFGVSNVDLHDLDAASVSADPFACSFVVTDGCCASFCLLL